MQGSRLLRWRRPLAGSANHLTGGAGLDCPHSTEDAPPHNKTGPYGKQAPLAHSSIPRWMHSLAPHAHKLTAMTAAQHSSGSSDTPWWMHS